MTYLEDASSLLVCVATVAVMTIPRWFENSFDASRELGCFSSWTTPSPPFKGAAVLITGAGTGLGKATSLRLVRAGWFVYAGVLSNEESNHLKTEAGSSRECMIPVILDVRKVANVREVLQRIDSSDHRLIAIVNNANVMAGLGPLEYVDVERDAHLSFDVGAYGTLRLVQASLPVLRKCTSKPRIIIISSGAGSLAIPFYGIYAMNKFALESCGDTLRRELDDVLVSIIEPTMISTDAAKGWTDSLDKSWPQFARTRYVNMRRGVEHQHEDLVRQGLSADQAARGICHAIASETPSIRYRLGLAAKLTSILGIAPAGFADLAIALARENA